jgi:MinD superfamily P-loop ATPase
MPLHREVYRGFVMTKPAVVLIGGDKGGVGKTTVARTLLDYFSHPQLRVRAFDTEVPRGTLKRFHPNVTDVARMSRAGVQFAHEIRGAADCGERGEAAGAIAEVKNKWPT